MKKKTFEELLGSVRQGGRILRRQTKPARVTHIPEEDLRAIRKKRRVSQTSATGEATTRAC